MDFVDASHWNTLREEYNALKERIDKAPMLRWSVYRLAEYEIQGSQGVYLVFDHDEELLDELCDYIISKESLLEQSLIVLKEIVFADGSRRVVGGNRYDNNGVLNRYPHDPIYDVTNIEGYLKQKHKMILQPIESIDMHCEKEIPEAKAYRKGEIFYLFPGDEEEEYRDDGEESDRDACEGKYADEGENEDGKVDIRYVW